MNSSRSSIRTAVIATAGFGTRFLPISKTIQKEMLPILDRPLVDYIVSDCVAAGIEKIIFIINEHNTQILHFYSENHRLHDYLKRMGKESMYAQVSHLHDQVEFVFVRQRDADAYGTATPIKLAEAYLKDEAAFLVLMGDDFIFNADGSSAIAEMIATFEKSQADGLITGVQKPDNLLHKYGILELSSQGNFDYLHNFVEKPAPGTAPSNLANISKYILNPTIFEILAHQPLNPASGELYITDTVLALAQSQKVVVHIPKGDYLDGGYLAGWLKANLMVLQSRPELKAEIAEFVHEQKLF
jgi:UTP--glucose-1-phosphate uridylyltransferase